MANLEIEGKLSGKSPAVGGKSARGEWKKQEFQVEFTEGKFPSTANFSVWGEDKIAELDKFSVGDEVKVSFNISSRDYNGRWYTDLRAWRIEAAGKAAAGPDSDYGGMPVPPPEEPASGFPSSASDDDLPF